MPVKLYYLPASAPCRSVQLVAAALGIELTLQRCSLADGDHLKPEFLAINPQHCIPTIEDDGYSLWESRAILTYLVNKYGKEDDALYPKDPAKRGTIDRLLYFDIGTLSKGFGEYFYPRYFRKEPHTPEQETKFKEALDLLNKFLEGNDYATGDTITIADLAFVPVLSNAELVGFDLSPYGNVVAYLDRLKKNVVEYDAINESGVQELKTLIQL